MTKEELDSHFEKRAKAVLDSFETVEEENYEELFTFVTHVLKIDFAINMEALMPDCKCTEDCGCK